MDKAVLSTMVFAAIVLMQMVVALECRGTPASLFSIGPFGNRLLIGALLAELLVLAAFVYVPSVYHVLGQHPLTPAQWLPVLVTPWLLLAAEETRKALARGRRRRRTDAPEARTRGLSPASRPVIRTGEPSRRAGGSSIQ